MLVNCFAAGECAVQHSKASLSRASPALDSVGSVVPWSVSNFILRVSVVVVSLFWHELVGMNDMNEHEFETYCCSFACGVVWCDYFQWVKV